MMIYRVIWMAFAGLFGVASSQAPEFTQQYKQRLGGAIQELNAVVADFDDDAKSNNLTRQQALETYSKSSQDFLQARGLSMGKTIRRLDALNAQHGELSTLSPVAQPMALMKNFDVEVAQGTWKDFNPAVPVTPHGLIWAGVGFLIGGIGVSATAFGVRRRRAKKHAENDDKNSPNEGQTALEGQTAQAREAARLNGLRVQAHLDERG